MSGSDVARKAATRKTPSGPASISRRRKQTDGGLRDGGTAGETHDLRARTDRVLSDDLAARHSLVNRLKPDLDAVRQPPMGPV